PGGACTKKAVAAKAPPTKAKTKAKAHKHKSPGVSAGQAAGACLPPALALLLHPVHRRIRPGNGLIRAPRAGRDGDDADAGARVVEADAAVVQFVVAFAGGHQAGLPGADGLGDALIANRRVAQGDGDEFV